MRRHLAVHSRLCASWNAPLDQSGCLRRAGVRRSHRGEARLWTWWGLAFPLASARTHLVCTLAVETTKDRAKFLDLEIMKGMKV